MKSSRRVLFYGNSVILGTLGANLGDYSQFEVTILTPPWPGRQRLEELAPDIIFFDLEAEHPEAAFSMLDSCPGLLIIGISPDSNLVKMWSGQQLKELSMEGLLAMINEQPKNSPAL